MNAHEFELKLKQIIKKVEDATGFCIEKTIISTSDPDFIPDFGMDSDGSIIIDSHTFPLKLEALTNIRYRWKQTDDYDECYIRFEFGPHIYINIYCDNGFFENIYDVKYEDTLHFMLKHLEVTEFLENQLSH